MPSSIFFHRYTLVPAHTKRLNSRTTAQSRDGVLIRVNGGYASIFPWPEFGDVSIDEQLRGLKNGQSTALTTQALHFAEIDAAARQQKLSLFTDAGIIPKSHHLIYTREQLEQRDQKGMIDGQTFKIKISGDFRHDFEVLNFFSSRPCLLRLDANAIFSPENFSNYWKQIDPEIKNKIEFVEDPTAYNAPDWKKLGEQGIPLAYDFYTSQSNGEFYQTRIIKPMVQPLYDTLVATEISAGKSVVVTSTLDHPVGVATAAWVSGTLSKKYPGLVKNGGYASFSAYEPDAFSETITGSDGGFQAPQKSSGFGFDSLLENIAWTELL